MKATVRGENITTSYVIIRQNRQQVKNLLETECHFIRKIQKVKMCMYFRTQLQNA